MAECKADYAEWCVSVGRDNAQIALILPINLGNIVLIMSTKRTLPSGSLHLFGDKSLVFWLKQGVIPLGDGLPLALPFVQLTSWQDQIYQPVSADVLAAEWRHQYDALPAAVKGLLSFEHFRAQQGDLASTVLASARQREHGQTLQYDPDRLAKARVARLFPSPLCYLAWREQADEFSGLALALASRHDSLASQEGRPALLAPVKYGVEHQFRVTATNPFPGLLSDHPACADNQEWRLLTTGNNVPVRPDPDQQETSVLPIQRDLVTAIYWSVNTPETTVNAIRQLVDWDMRYRSVALGRVVPDSGRWQLRLQPVSR